MGLLFEQKRYQRASPMGKIGFERGKGRWEIAWKKSRACRRRKCIPKRGTLL